MILNKEQKERINEEANTSLQLIKNVFHDPAWYDDFANEFKKFMRSLDDATSFSEIYQLRKEFITTIENNFSDRMLRGNIMTLTSFLRNGGRVFNDITRNEVELEQFNLAIQRPSSKDILRHEISQLLTFLEKTKKDSSVSKHLEKLLESLDNNKPVTKDFLNNLTESLDSLYEATNKRTPARRGYDKTIGSIWSEPKKLSDAELTINTLTAHLIKNINIAKSPDLPSERFLWPASDISSSEKKPTPGGPAAPGT